MNATQCKCGAVTVEIDGQEYSMPAKEFRKKFGRRQLKSTFCCNYCVNHWGTDLCGCGSGKKFGKCSAKLQECERPAQIIEMGVAKCTCEGAWA